MNKKHMKSNDENTSKPGKADMQAQISAHLLQKYGPVLGPEALWQVLGFKTRQAFDRSVLRRVTKLPLFRPVGREGVYVLAPALAAHIVNMAEDTQLEKEDDSPKP